MRNYKTIALPGSNGKHHLQANGYNNQRPFNIGLLINMLNAPPASADDHVDLQGAVVAVVARIMEISGEMPLNALVAACQCVAAVSRSKEHHHQLQ